MLRLGMGQLVGIWSTTSDVGSSRGRDGGLTDFRCQCVEGCGDAGIAPGSEWLGDRGLCEGDSGGPALDAHGALIGIGLRGGADAMGDCAGGIFARLDAWRTFLTESVRAITAEGGIPAWAQSRSDATESDSPSSGDASDVYSNMTSAEHDANPMGREDREEISETCGPSLDCTQEQSVTGSPLVAGGGCSCRVVPGASSPLGWRLAGILIGLASTARRRLPVNASGRGG
jgi:hypothetical protein